MHYSVLLPTLCLALTLTTIPSQGGSNNIGSTDYGFDLSAYRPPEYVRHGLVLSPYVSLRGIGLDHYQFDPDSTSDTTSIEKRNYSGIDADLGTRYFREAFTLDREYSLRTSVDVDGGFSPEKEWEYSPYYFREITVEESFSTRFSYWLYTQFEKRYYLGRAFFIGGFLDGGFSDNPVGDSRSTEKSLQRRTDSLRLYSYVEREGNSRYSGLNAKLKLSSGVGRVYDVTAGAVSQNMFDRLATLSSVRGLSSEDVRNLSVVLDRLRERRILDSRKGKIETIDSIITFLRNEDILESVSAGAVMEIVDQYEYAFKQVRRTGRRLTVNAVGQIRQNVSNHDRKVRQYDENVPLSGGLRDQIDDMNEPDSLGETHTKEEDRNSGTAFGISVDFVYTEPLGRFRQLTATAENVYVRNYEVTRTAEEEILPERTDTSSVTKLAYPEVHGLLELRLSWYPNTRTTASITLNGNYLYEFDYLYKYIDGEKQSLDNDVWKLESSVGCRLEYYLSPRVTVNIDAHGYLGREKNRYRSYEPEFKYELSGGIEWSIF